MEEIREKLEKAHPSKATIIASSIPRSLIRPARMGCVNTQLTLDIQSISGNYQTSVLWEVEQTAMTELQTGKIIEVKIDADDKTKVYPKVKWAEYKWS